ncbi:hypothetical protein ACUN0C_18825 [Faunimonas sp. B44]|uniref:hypothetical protein n=1 Tax=Faunimonas sp. B44 TaxID=3461493 RepID=UPI004043C6E2
MGRFPGAARTDWAAIRRDWENPDVTLDAIARRSGIATGEIRRRARLAGWPPRPPEKPRVPARLGGPPDPAVDWDAVRAAYEAEDRPLRDVLAQFRLTHHELRRAMERQGWRKRRGIDGQRSGPRPSRPEAIEARIEELVSAGLGQIEAMRLAGSADHAGMLRLLAQVMRVWRALEAMRQGKGAAGKRKGSAGEAARRREAEMRDADVAWLRRELQARHERLQREAARQAAPAAGSKAE